jgi:hypothetical protein
MSISDSAPYPLIVHAGSRWTVITIQEAEEVLLVQCLDAPCISSATHVALNSQFIVVAFGMWLEGHKL